MYIRFVRKVPVEGMDARAGIFDAAYELCWADTTDKATADAVETLIKWFKANLPIPPRFNRSTSKGHYRRNSRGLSWFKPSAHAQITKAFELAGILRQNGDPIEILKETRIGYVVYEDDIQIVAEPFSDTRR